MSQIQINLGIKLSGVNRTQYFPKITVLCLFSKQNIPNVFPNIFPLKEIDVPSPSQNWEKSYNFPKFEL